MRGLESFEREIKRELLETLEKKARDKLHKVIEWLWENYGVRVKMEWGSVEKAVLKSRDVSSREIALLMMDLGVDVDEEIWFRHMRSRRKN